MATDLGDEVNLVRAFVSRRAVSADGVVGAATLDEATLAVLDRARELREVTERLLRADEPAGPAQ